MKRFNCIAAFALWTCSFVGGLAWFVIWAQLMRYNVQSASVMAISRLSGLIPLLVVTWSWALRNMDYRYRTFRATAMWGSAGFGLLMLVLGVLAQLRN